MSDPITDHPYRPDRAGQWRTGRCDKCGEPRAAHDHTQNATTAPSGDVQGERAHRDDTAAQGSAQGDTGGKR